MSHSPITFSDPISIIVCHRWHPFHAFPNPILIVHTYDRVLSHGQLICIYVSDINSFYSAIMEELHVTTLISHIFCIDHPVPPVQWYLSFLHHPRQVYHFLGYVCIVHNGGLWVTESYGIFLFFFWCAYLWLLWIFECFLSQMDYLYAVYSLACLLLFFQNFSCIDHWGTYWNADFCTYTFLLCA
jgi:hypothetical protein